jgi:hypothetical protein
MNDAAQPIVGFAPDEIDTAAPTRAARLKWVIVVDDSIPLGRAVNAAVCVASATARGVAGLLGPGVTDPAGETHPGLPWAGCTVLSASGDTLRAIRAKGIAHEATFVADMPRAAQETRVYDEYLEEMASADPLTTEYLAVSLVGPKNRIDKIVGRLPLMP